MTEVSLTQSVEDYLKAVYRLGKSGRVVATSELAEELSVAPASVTGMLKKLSKDGYIDYTPRQGAELTAKGLEVALEIIRHHRLLELFFVERLGMSWAKAHQEAETLEHFISEELENLIDAAMGHPEADPQGAPIPTRNGEIKVQPWHCLAGVPAGIGCTVRRVEHEQPELLQYVEQIGLVPGAELSVREIAPFEGPITIVLADREIHLGPKVAAAILVERHEPVSGVPHPSEVNEERPDGQRSTGRSR
jgi:DtxR family Mn-dependent transcriptional regulator